jgi:hypothetical protein
LLNKPSVPRLKGILRSEILRSDVVEVVHPLEAALEEPILPRFPMEMMVVADPINLLLLVHTEGPDEILRSDVVEVVHPLEAALEELILPRFPMEMMVAADPINLLLLVHTESLEASTSRMKKEALASLSVGRPVPGKSRGR